eukprot:10257842-Prorocentrum_lima.AAC.1
MLLMVIEPYSVGIDIYHLPPSARDHDGMRKMRRIAFKDGTCTAGNSCLYKMVLDTTWPVELRCRPRSPI